MPESAWRTPAPLAAARAGGSKELVSVLAGGLRPAVRCWDRRTQEQGGFSMEPTKFDRRKLLTGGAALAGGTVALGLAGTERCLEAAAPGGVTSGTTIAASDHNAVVDTTAGKVRGFTRNGIQTFSSVFQV